MSQFDINKEKCDDDEEEEEEVSRASAYGESKAK